MGVAIQPRNQYLRGMDDVPRIHISLRHVRGLGSHIYVTIKSESADVGERVMKFNRRETARRWVDHVVDTEYAPNTEVIWDSTETYRWFYPEGD